MDFFDRTPIGSIVNRFSKDIQGLGKNMHLNIVDDVMPNCVFMIVKITTSVLASFIIIIIAVPFMLVPVVISVCLLYYIKIRLSSSIQYLHGTSQSQEHQSIQSLVRQLTDSWRFVRTTNRSSLLQTLYMTRTSFWTSLWLISDFRCTWDSWMTLSDFEYSPLT